MRSSLYTFHSSLFKVKAYAELFKLRLATLVVFSSVLGYLIVANYPSLFEIAVLSISAFLITGASNTINQVIERDTDKLMSRTANRPIPTEKVSISESIVLAGVSAITGITILSFFFNPLAGLLSAVSLLIYAFIYTPAKRYGSFAVFIGAIPGALPPMIGVVAYEGKITYLALLLFSIQFIWQFPHFWAIAWVAFEDYARAGFHLLPSNGGKDRYSVLQMIIYTSALIPISLIPLWMKMVNPIGTVLLFLSGVVFTIPAVRLYMKQSDQMAKQLMFYSFAYLPVMLIIFWVCKY